MLGAGASAPVRGMKRRRLSLADAGRRGAADEIVRRSCKSAKGSNLPHLTNLLYLWANGSTIAPSGSRPDQNSTRREPRTDRGAPVCIVVRFDDVG
jgi:hypothetical protein